MSNTITVEKAAAGLSELISSLGPGDEIVVTRNDKPVARILPSRDMATHRQKKKRVAGRCKGMLTIVREDESHLEGFEEYM